MSAKKIAILALGFRPFYLLASLWAVFGILEWLLELQGVGLRRFNALPGIQWHSHEMIFGFAATVVTGFALTAVRAWTGLDTPTGLKLFLLVTLWITARIGAFTGNIFILADICFLPVIAIVIGRLIFKARMYRNFFLPLILIVLGGLNACFYLSVLGYVNLDANALIFDSLYLIIMIQIMIGNRIIPSFTANAIPGLKQNRSQTLTKAAVMGSAFTFLLQMFAPSGPMNAVACFAMAVIHIILTWGWRPLATKDKPMLWILHISYSWIVLGFLMLGLFQLRVISIYPALHVFGIGATGGLIISMITRTALGHTGRPVVAGLSETTCYLGIQATFLLWLLANARHDAWFYPLMVIAGCCWMSVFMIYIIKYFPLLAQPRSDGKAG